MEEQIKDIINYLLSENNLWNLKQSDINIDDSIKEEVKVEILKKILKEVQITLLCQ